jgi:hypothetical protein
MYPQKSGNGVLILILGILAWLACGCFTGLPAWIMGNNALRDIENGYSDPGEMGMVQAGRVLGMVNTILMAAAILVVICVVGVAAIAGSGGSAR